MEFPILQSNTESRRTKNMCFVVFVCLESTCWTRFSFWQTSHSSDIIDLRLSGNFYWSKLWALSQSPSELWLGISTISSHLLFSERSPCFFSCLYQLLHIWLQDKNCIYWKMTSDKFISLLKIYTGWFFGYTKIIDTFLRLSLKSTVKQSTTRLLFCAIKYVISVH